LLFDSQNRLWCSIGERGLFRFNETGGPQFHPVMFSQRQGLSSPNITAILEDNQGWIYVGSSRGIDRIDPRSGTVNRFGPAGALWICLQSRIVRMLPASLRTAPSTPVLIGAVRVSGVEYQVPAVGARALELKDLPPQKNSIQIDFLRPAFALEDAPVFQYRLDDASSEWSPPTSLGTVNYADLSPGSYRFRVRQAAPEGEPAGPAAELSFRILPPFWRQWWFVPAAAMLVLGSAAGFERYRAAKLKQVASALAAVRKAHGALETEFAISRIVAQFTEKEAALPALLETICQRMGWNRGTLWEASRSRDGSAPLHRRVAGSARGTVSGGEGARAWAGSGGRCFGFSGAELD
jgi:hypothetical protein